MDSPPDDTLDQLRAAKQGDRAALDALLSRYRPLLLQRIRIMLGASARRAAESSDFVQITLMQALQGLERFEPQGERAFLGWLTQIAHNRIRDAANRKHAAAFDELASRLCDTRTPSPSTEAARSEQRARILEAIETLGEDDRAVLELRDLEGLPFAAIAERLGRTENAVQLLHTRALVRLGSLLRRDGHGGS